MKKQILLLLLLAVMSFIFIADTASAAKKVERREYFVYVQQGKTYKLSKILSELKDKEEDKTLQKTLKGKKVDWSAKKTQIKLTKKSVKVKKQGEFKLTGRTKTCKHIITLKSMPEKWSAIPEGIASASIMQYGRMIEVKDPATVAELCNIFNSADYRFGDIYTLVPPGWTYSIKLYDSAGKEKRSFTIGYRLSGGYYSKKWKEVEKYVGELYNKLLGEQNPGAA